MKKVFFTLVLMVAMSLAANAQDGFFQGEGGSYDRDGGSGSTPNIGLPVHNQGADQPAPLGSGLLVLTAFGAGYALRKRNK